jgi:hypothetical protein
MFTEVWYHRLGPLPARPGALAQSLQVNNGGLPARLYIAPRQLHTYLATLVATVAPADRTFGPLPPLPTAPHDPVGAWGAAQAVGAPDPRTWVPLRALFEAHRRGQLDTAEAGTLAPAMVELARSIRYGRGAGPAGWRTALPARVFGYALRGVLGAPATVQPAPGGGTVTEFAVGAGSGKGGAIASSVVGLALLATVGVGWVATSHGHRLAAIRVQVVEAPDGGTAFQLLGSTGAGWQPLSVHWWRAVDAIHQALFRMEARYLLGRVLMAGTQPPEQLLAVPREVLERRAAPLVGPLDLSVCYSS